MTFSSATSIFVVGMAGLLALAPADAAQLLSTQASETFGGSADGGIATVKAADVFLPAVPNLMANFPYRPANDATAHDDMVAKVVNDPAELPEPANWGLMLLGFSSLGYIMRRPQSDSARIRFT